jgi:hypothetical protein
VARLTRELNYGCPYCPFAKTRDDRAALAADQAALVRFADWAKSRPTPVSILITPWGEALIRRYYRDAMVALSHAPNIGTVAIQTNLSCSLSWLEQANLARLALWTTYHPGETDRRAFIAKISRLEALGARYSVGIVGLREHIGEAERLRAELPSGATLWINAFKRSPDYYTAADLDRLHAVDPLFDLNARAYPSRGRACHAGETAISVAADGTARRCHFLPDAIGNIYDADFEAALRPRPCPAATCGCHIGYSHLKALNLRTLFGDGFLERRPAHPVTIADAENHIATFDAGDRAPS